MSKELLDLAVRCEKASGPDVILESIVGRAIGIREPVDPSTPYCPRYTASLDAALFLPEDWTWAVDASEPSLGIIAKAFPPRLGHMKHVEAKAATPALALCAAALRAHASDRGEG